MGWAEWRQETAGNLKSQGGGRKFPPWQAALIMAAAGDDFQAALLNEPPYLRALHWTDLPHECTSDNPLFEGKCVYCDDAQQKEIENEKIEARGGQPKQFKHYRRQAFVIRAVDFRMFHFVPDPKKEGKSMVAACQFPDLDVPAGAPDVCAWCRHQDKYVAERRFLGVRRWEIETASDLWKTVLSADRRMNETCLHVYPDGRCCNGRNFLTSLMCGECGHLYKTSDEIHKNKADTATFAEQVQECPACHKKGKPHAEWTCSRAVKDGTPECPHHMSLPATLPDGVIHVVCRGEKNTQGNVVRKYAVDGDHRVTAADVLRERYNMDDAAIEKLLTSNVEMARLYYPERKDPTGEDFNKGGKFDKDGYVLAVLTAQAENLGVENPYVAGTTSTSRPFAAGRRQYVAEEDGAGRD
jgi:hypothetical protein